MKIRMAGLVAELQNRYSYTEEQCRSYRVDENTPADLLALATEDEIQKELSLCMSATELGSAESICLYRSVAAQLHRFGALLMHGAVIGYEERAYAFLAPSGTGKSTHIRLWRTHLRDGVYPINGDKPILRLQEGVFTANGTPWAGKEGWQQNISRPLEGICLLTRGTENKIVRLDPSQALGTLMRQIYVPKDPEGALATMALVDELVKKVPMYLLACNMTEEAAKTSFEAMTGCNFEEAKGKYQ